jgi:hypothetical protein
LAGFSCEETTSAWGEEEPFFFCRREREPFGCREQEALFRKVEEIFKPKKLKNYFSSREYIPCWLQRRKYWVCLNSRGNIFTFFLEGWENI